MRILLRDVIVGAGRRPLDEAYLATLVDSIKAVGLLNPITVTKAGNRFRLVAGRHRLEAGKRLGWTEIEAGLAVFSDWCAELAEIDENLIRNELTALEHAQHLKRRKEIYEKRYPETKRGSGGGRAKEARRSGVPAPESGVSTPAFVTETAALTKSSPSKVREEVQIATAIPEDVQEQIAELDLADKPTDLLKIARLPEEQQRKVVAVIASAPAHDRGGSAREVTVTEALRQIKREEVAEVEPLPTGKYRVIYADPAWQYSDSRTGLESYSQTAAEDQYPTMSVEELCALDVGALAEDDAVLFCWATFPLLPDALTVVKAWGFKYKTAFVWAKGRANFGHYHNASAELLLVCTRGSATPDLETRESQVQAVERTGRHSEKPEHFRALIDRLYAHGNRIELFRRGAAPDGWAIWGNEARADEAAL